MREPSVKGAIELADKLQLQVVHQMKMSGQRVEGDDLEGSLAYELVRSAVGWVVVDGVLRVIVPMALNIQRVRPGGAKIVIANVESVFRLDYGPHAGQPIPEDVQKVADFAAVTGFMHAWPYFRADVQSLVAKLELPTLTLPVLLSGMVPALVAAVRLTPEGTVFDEPKSVSQPSVKNLAASTEANGCVGKKRRA